MAKGLAAALAAITALMLIPAAAPAKRIAGVNVKPGCDFIGTGVCQFPWPNDYFTKRDRRTDTGRRLALVKSAMPRNKSGKPIDPTRHEPRRRLQPRQRDAREGARARHARGRRARASCRRSPT